MEGALCKEANKRSQLFHNVRLPLQEAAVDLLSGATTPEMCSWYVTPLPPAKAKLLQCQPFSTKGF